MYLQKPAYYTKDNKVMIFFVTDNSIYKLTSNSIQDILNKEYQVHKFFDGAGEIGSMIISPDGTQLAFSSNLECAAQDIYVMPTDGGTPERITYINSTRLLITQWSDQITFASNHAESSKGLQAYSVTPGCRPVKLSEDIISWIYSDDKYTSIQQFGYGYGTWRKYQGGGTGKIWLKQNDSKFDKVVDNGFNALKPVITNGNIYYLSDIDGVGNIYSYHIEKGTHAQITHETDFYVEHFSVCNKDIIYSCAGDLFIIIHSECKKLPIQIHSYTPHLQVRPLSSKGDYNVSISDSMQSYTLHSEGKKFACILRGKVFEMPIYTSAANTVCANLFCSLVEYIGNKLLVVEIGKQEKIHLLSDDRTIEKTFEHDFGHITNISVHSKNIAITNNRSQLFILNLETGDITEVLPAQYYTHIYLDWSPQGRYLTYTKRLSQSESGRVICVYDTTNKKEYQITHECYKDICPKFDTSGKYLYFLSDRNITPEHDTIKTDLHFAEEYHPYIVLLQKDTENPFIHVDIKDDSKDEHKNDKDKKDETEETKEDLIIDFDDIQYRCFILPGTQAQFSKLEIYQKDILLFTDNADGGYDVEKYVLEQHKHTTLLSDLKHLGTATNKQHIFYYTKDNQIKINVVGTDEPEWKAQGAIKWNRMISFVDPKREFDIIFDQAWFLMKENFQHTEGFKPDWNNIYNKYKPLSAKVSCREELNIVIAYMQGELESSHAYVLAAGDTKSKLNQTQGCLGAEFDWSAEHDGYKITKILYGNTWGVNQNTSSPLSRFKINDVITHINGVKLSDKVYPEFVLRNMANCIIPITMKTEYGSPIAYIQTMTDEGTLRYIESIKHNRQLVSDLNQDLGYIHIPNMMETGYTQFCKDFLAHNNKKGLIIDLRYNGGGYVSPMIVDMLARKSLGYISTKYGKSTEPYDIFQGKMIFLINGFTGSDGDIMSYTVKKLGLGKLVGMRTWGGIISIMPRYSFVDNGLTSQPEFAIDMINDNGEHVENYGIDPDVIVEHAPGIHEDVQLLKAVALLTEELTQK